MLLGTPSSPFPLHLLLFAPFAFIGFLYLVTILSLAGRFAWSTFDTSLKKFVPADPTPWYRWTWPVALVAVGAWLGGLVFLALLRDWQLGTAALESDRQRFCDAVAYGFAVPYRVLSALVAFLLTLRPIQHLFWLVPLLLIVVPLGTGSSFFTWLGGQLRRILASPLLILGVVRGERPQAARCDAAVCAAAVPLVLVLLGAAGVLTLPMAALWYLLAVTFLSLLTLGTFADDKLAAQWNEVCQRRDDEARRAYEERRRGIMASRARAGIPQAVSWRFDDDDDPQFALPSPPRKGRDYRSRVSEAALLILVLLGGWPGAVTGQRLLTHKIADKKAWFVAHLYGMIALHNGLSLTALYLWA